MNIEDIKAKLQEYPVATGAVVVALLSGALIYWRSDVEQQLAAERESKTKELQEIRLNDANAKNLDRDINRIKAIYAKIFEQAMDFESTIAAQAFFADFIQNSTVKAEGLPVQQALPVLSATAKPLAYCGYMLHSSSDFPGLINFMASLDANRDRSMVINRIQLVSGAVGSKSNPVSPGSVVESDVSFRLWGRKGVQEPVKATSDKKVVSSASRNGTLSMAEKFLSATNVDLSLASNPFSAPGLATPVTVATSAVAPEVETALNNLKFTIIEFLGAPAVKLDGSLPKRVNNEFELKISGKAVKFKIASIASDSFTVVTSTGKKIQVLQKK